MTPTSAALIAEEFHATYETLAPAHGYETREASRTTWDQVPEQNRKLMTAVVVDLISRRVIGPGDAIPGAVVLTRDEAEVFRAIVMGDSFDGDRLKQAMTALDQQLDPLGERQ